MFNEISGNFNYRRRRLKRRNPRVVPQGSRGAINPSSDNGCGPENRQSNERYSPDSFGSITKARAFLIKHDCKDLSQVGDSKLRQKIKNARRIIKRADARNERRRKKAAAERLIDLGAKLLRAQVEQGISRRPNPNPDLLDIEEYYDLLEEELRHQIELGLKNHDSIPYIKEFVLNYVAVGAEGDRQILAETRRKFEQESGEAPKLPSGIQDLEEGMLEPAYTTYGPTQCPDCGAEFSKTFNTETHCPTCGNKLNGRTSSGIRAKLPQMSEQIQEFDDTELLIPEDLEEERRVPRGCHRFEKLYDHNGDIVYFEVIYGEDGSTDYRRIVAPEKPNYDTLDLVLDLTEGRKLLQVTINPRGNPTMRTIKIPQDSPILKMYESSYLYKVRRLVSGTIDHGNFVRQMEDAFKSNEKRFYKKKSKSRSKLKRKKNRRK